MFSNLITQKDFKELQFKLIYFILQLIFVSIIGFQKWNFLNFEFYNIFFNLEVNNYLVYVLFFLDKIDLQILNKLFFFVLIFCLMIYNISFLIFFNSSFFLRSEWIKLSLFLLFFLIISNIFFKYFYYSILNWFSFDLIELFNKNFFSLTFYGSFIKYEIYLFLALLIISYFCFISIYMFIYKLIFYSIFKNFYRNIYFLLLFCLFLFNLVYFNNFNLFFYNLIALFFFEFIFICILFFKNFIVFFAVEDKNLIE
jgi:hypothetical protein